MNRALSWARTLALNSFRGLTPFDRTIIYGCLVFLAIGISLIAGCAHDPASKARQGGEIATAAHDASVDVAELVDDKCAADANTKPTKAEKQAALDKCKATHAKLSKAFRSYMDALHAYSAAIDAGEAISAKDYNDAQQRLFAAGLYLANALVDAGVKAPMPIPGGQ